MKQTYGKRIFRYLNNADRPEKSDFFIGVVRAFVEKDSDLFESYSEHEIYKDVIDNRNLIYITPADEHINVIEPAIFLNSHEMDLPLIGEAVFCVKTNMGNFILDRFSINQFALNEDIYEYLITNIGGESTLDIEFPEGYEDKVLKEPVSDVAPFDPKIGSKVWLGRNNQYMIFDSGSRKKAGVREKQTSEEGSFVKMGFRINGSQTDSREDPTMVTMVRNASLNNVMTEQYRSKERPEGEEEPKNGYGIQSDHIVLIGRRYTVIYSLRDIIIEAKRYIIQRATKMDISVDEYLLKSKNITLGSENASEPFVKGEQLMSLLQDIISLIENGTYLVTGTSATADPTFRARLRQFKSTKLNKFSKVLSKKIKGE